MRPDRPEWLVPSARTDIGLLLAGRKPAARIDGRGMDHEIRRWARRRGLFTSGDGSGYLVLARCGNLSRRAIALDGRPGRHTQALGRMLGYPNCCSRAAARVGDEGIDGMAATVGAHRFHGRFQAFDPTSYRSGGSLLAHVPCSHRCARSLALALDTSRC